MTDKLAALFARMEKTMRFATDEEIAEHDAAIAQAEAEQVRRVRRERLDRARPPVTAGDYELLEHGRLDPNPFTLAVDDALDGRDRRPWLLFLGSTGRGKTVAAASAIARRGGAWLHARDLVRTYESFETEDRRRIERARVLLLDELGREREPKDRFVPYLEQLCDCRKGPGMLTIVTSNMSGEKLGRRYEDEDRLWSRFAQATRAVQDAGPDLRRAS